MLKQPDPLSFELELAEVSACNVAGSSPLKLSDVGHRSRAEPVIEGSLLHAQSMVAFSRPRYRRSIWRASMRGPNAGGETWLASRSRCTRPR
jgi:hypothetical protein